MHIRSPRWYCLLTFVLLGTATPLRAQKLECVLPRETNPAGQCLATVSKDSSGVTVILRFVSSPDTVSGKRVTFRLLPGSSGSVTDTARTGPDGLVQVRWTGNPGAGTAVFVATTVSRGQMISREVKIEAAPAKSPAFTLTFRSGNRQVWYEKRQLPRPLEVEVRGTDAECTGAVVFFRPSAGGIASPDSVYAVRETDLDTQASACVARSFWKLGEGVGTQHVIASVRGNPGQNVTATARARLLPRIGAGIAVTRDRGYSVPEADTVTNVTAVKRVKADYAFRPVISADFPIFRRVPGLRGSVGVSMVSPERDWYLGASALQPFYGIAHEALGIDVHAIAHFGRRTVLEDAEACRTEQECDTDDELLVLGAGLMFVVDGTALLGTLTGALAGK